MYAFAYLLQNTTCGDRARNLDTYATYKMANVSEFSTHRGRPMSVRRDTSKRHPICLEGALSEIAAFFAFSEILGIWGSCGLSKTRIIKLINI